MLPRVKELAKNGFALYRAHMKEFVTYTAIGLAPWLLISFLSSLSILVPSPDSLAITVIAIIVIVVAILGTVLSATGSLALIRVIAARYTNTTPQSPLNEIRMSVRSLIPFIFSSILAGLATILGLFFFIVPGIIMGAWFMFVRQAVAIDHSSSIAALKNSKRAVEGRWWGMVGRTMAIGIIYGIPVFIILAITEAFINGLLAVDPTPGGIVTRIVGAIIAYVALSVLAPLIDIAHAILYVEGKKSADMLEHTVTPASI